LPEVGGCFEKAQIGQAEAEGMDKKNRNICLTGFAKFL